MNIFLTSTLNTKKRGWFNIYRTVALGNENHLVDNIKRLLKSDKRIVFVANNKDEHFVNDEKSRRVFKSFKKAGLNFQEKIILDSRNQDQAKDIILGADIVILSGGKCLCEIEFFDDIELSEILKQYNGIVIGISAGSMNLCNTVANFPEELVDKDEPRWLDGLGFYDEIIIPHFDGNNYQFKLQEIDVVNEYILPMSNHHDFIGLPNGSYILIENGKPNLYGNAFRISQGKVSPLESI